MFEINGSRGPHALNSTPGAYGRNASLAVQNVQKQNPALLKDAAVRYTDPQQKSVDDVFGYAQEDIRGLDRNQNGALGFDEVSAFFGGESAASYRYMVSNDINSDGHIDGVEHAAQILFQDKNRDGVIDPTERMRAQEEMMSNPNAVRAQMGQIIQQGQLPAAYQQFQQRGGGHNPNQPPGQPGQSGSPLQLVVGLFTQMLNILGKVL